jgi:hypothetical protein
MPELERCNSVAFVAGMRKSGKSQLLADLFVPAHQRIISIDVTGETVERNPDAIAAYGMGQLVEVLHVAADWPRWHVAAILPRAEIPELCKLLAPRVESEDTLSFSRELGGIAIECGEAYHVLPNQGTAVEVEDALCISRHHRLSWLLATQRPASCSRLLSSQADYLVAFMQSEPLDIAWWSKAVSKAAGVQIQQLELHEFVFYRRGDPTFYVCDAARRVRAAYKLNGDSVTAAAPPRRVTRAAPRESVTR